MQSALTVATLAVVLMLGCDRKRDAERAAAAAAAADAERAAVVAKQAETAAAYAAAIDAASKLRQLIAHPKDPAEDVADVKFNASVEKARAGLAETDPRWTEVNRLQTAVYLARTYRNLSAGRRGAATTSAESLVEAKQKMNDALVNLEKAIASARARVQP